MSKNSKTKQIRSLKLLFLLLAIEKTTRMARFTCEYKIFLGLKRSGVLWQLELLNATIQ